MNSTKDLGKWGEDEAAHYLQRQGLKLLERQFRTPRGEIDLIFREDDTLVFVEVKTRTQTWEPSALEAITPAKQKKLIGAALMYMKKNRLTDVAMRFDVIAFEGGHLEWIPNAFESSTFYSY